MQQQQQDRVNFLQYRLEQQDDEIKSLRRQLLLSPAFTATSQPRISENSRGAEHENHDEMKRKEPDTGFEDLETFLSEAKRRVEKMDVAVTKVDTVVQEMLARKRVSSHAASELFSRLKLSESCASASVSVYFTFHLFSINGYLHMLSLTRIYATKAQSQKYKISHAILFVFQILKNLNILF